MVARWSCQENIWSEKLQQGPKELFSFVPVAGFQPVVAMNLTNWVSTQKHQVFEKGRTRYVLSLIIQFVSEFAQAIYQYYDLSLFFVQTYDIPCKNTFTTVKPLSRHCITSISPGKTHSAAIDRKLLNGGVKRQDCVYYAQARRGRK